MSIPHKIVEQSDTAPLRVTSGGAVTAWLLSEKRETLYEGVAAPAEDRVNYRFINGFVDVGDLPCRVAWLDEIKTRAVPFDNRWSVDAVYLPGLNRRVEFTDFWPRPTHLSRTARTTIVPPSDGDYTFRLSTCGGVHLWVDGTLHTKFEPYDRNIEHSVEISLPLKASGSEIVVLTEDLGERDAIWFFELVSLSNCELELVLPGGFDRSDMEVLRKLAMQVRPARDYFENEPVELLFDVAASRDVTIEARVNATSLSRSKKTTFNAVCHLFPGDTQVVLGHSDALIDGMHWLELIFSCGKAKLERRISFATLENCHATTLEGNLETRKKAALDFAAKHGDFRAGRALAMLASGIAFNAQIEQIIAQTLVPINERHDCSDFVLVPLLWLYAGYKEKLPKPVADSIRDAALNYRYWVDEPGNDVMWYWSENHVLCFHTSQLLAGMLFPDEVFAASGRIGALQLEIALERLEKWFTSVDEEGLAEWNSAAYYPIDFIGLLALFDWAPDGVRVRAKAVLDRLMLMIALHSLGGVPGGSMGRAYDKELRAGPLTELAPFSTVAFGKGWLNGGVASLPEFCAGTYVPPEGLDRLVYLPEDKAITAHYVQGYDEAARLALYKLKSVQMSAMVDGKPGGRGHQQHVFDVRFAAHPFAKAWINHPGEDDPWGGQRPSYWAGNGSMPRVAQFGNAALMMFDLGENSRSPYTHAYASHHGTDSVEIWKNWLLIRSGDGYAAFKPSTNLQAVTEGPGAGREFRAHGTRVAWLMLVSQGGGDAGLSVFKRELEQVVMNFDPGQLSFSVRRDGAPHLVLDWANGLSVEGECYVFPNRDIDPEINWLPSGI